MMMMMIPLSYLSWSVLDVLYILFAGPMTAENFITIFYSDWSFDHAYTNLVVLAIFITVLRVLTYFSYKYIDHSKR